MYIIHIPPIPIAARLAAVNVRVLVKKPVKMTGLESSKTKEIEYSMVMLYRYAQLLLITSQWQSFKSLCRSYFLFDNKKEKCDIIRSSDHYSQ